jgi:hypothetical protein
VAYIYKGQSATAEPLSLLSKADFSRQRDTYVLASRFKNRDCMRLWNDFAAEQPAMARLIIKDVDNERVATAAANETVDGRLREAEQLVAKSARPGPQVLKDALQAAERVLIEAERESTNPLFREWRRMAAHE